jgi:excisionase family DNA binding protein
MASNYHVKAQKKQVKSSTNGAIEPGAVYSRAEAARIVGVSQITLWRALERGHIGCYRRGRRVLHSGQHLLDWLRQGECPAKTTPMRETMFHPPGHSNRH